MQWSLRAALEPFQSMYGGLPINRMHLLTHPVTMVAYALSIKRAVRIYDWPRLRPLQSDLVPTPTEGRMHFKLNLAARALYKYVQRVNSSVLVSQEGLHCIATKIRCGSDQP
jgi:hypothetical protein